MGMFGFDEQFTMFDITPVENHFILEDMPGARGDFVKVYLYGLLLCYHPQEDMSLAKLCHDLSLTEEDVLAAYRHWERKGLVRRISDKPPAWRYVNAKQQLFMHDSAPVDAAYADFAEALHAQFGYDRSLSSKEINMAYEWVEELKLPVEVVLMLVQHCITTKGKQFSFTAAQKTAVRLAEEKVQSLEEAEEVLARDEIVKANVRSLVRRLGKRREPSVDEMNMYLRWTKEWGYTYEAIEAACAETTKGEPTFAYLDGILRGMLKRNGKAMTSAAQVQEARTDENDRIAPLKALIATLNNHNLTVNESTLSVYNDLRTMYTDDVILLAGRECARVGKNYLDDVTALLESWHGRGLRNVREVQRYVEGFKGQNQLIAALYELWGKQGRPSAGDRKLLTRWTEELGFTQEMILFCASFAEDADKPMAYLDKILAAYAQQGITTPEAAAAARTAFAAAQSSQPAQGGAMQPAAQRQGKVVREQQYTQREYQNTDGMTERMLQRLKELKTDA